MARVSRILLLLLLITSSVLGEKTRGGLCSPSEKEHTQWIDNILRSVSTLKPGMTRKDLSKLFTEEGGLSTRTQRTYVYKQCLHIKLDVEFAPVPHGTSVSDEMPEDVIVKISRPYLQYTISD
jgi:hypothetical protein